MKKLLFSLFAIATMFVACDKDYDDGIDIVGEQEILMETSGMSHEEAFEFFNDLIENIDVKSLEPATLDLADRNSANKIDVAFFSDTTTQEKAHMVSEDNTVDRCYQRYTLNGNFEYSLSANGQTLHLFNHQTPDVAARDFTLSPGLRSRYAAVFGANLNTINNIRRVNGNPVAVLGAQPNIADFDFSCPTVSAAWTAGTGDDANLWSKAGFGSYRVTDAPFPLTGKLATVVSKDSAIESQTVLNYAATSEQAVRDAIEADFENGN